MNRSDPAINENLIRLDAQLTLAAPFSLQEKGRAALDKGRGAGQVSTPFPALSRRVREISNAAEIRCWSGMKMALQQISPSFLGLI